MHASRVHASRILARKTVAQKLRWSSTEAVGANLGVTPEFGIPNDGSSGSSSTGPESNPSIQKREQKFQRHVKHKSISPRLESQDLCTITIRTWTFMTHISQLYTLVRALEEKYGPIREFRFRKVCFPYFFIQRDANSTHNRTTKLTPAINSLATQFSATKPHWKKFLEMESLSMSLRQISPRARPKPLQSQAPARARNRYSTLTSFLLLNMSTEAGDWIVLRIA